MIIIITMDEIDSMWVTVFFVSEWLRHCLDIIFDWDKMNDELIDMLKCMFI